MLHYILTTSFGNFLEAGALPGNSRIIFAVGAVISSTSLRRFITATVTSVALANIGNSRCAGVGNCSGIF